MPGFRTFRLCAVMRLLAALSLLTMAQASCAETFILYAGSYTAGTSKGIYAWRFDTKDGDMQPLGLVAATPQPAHLWAAPDNTTLYAVNWQPQGGVSAFHIDRKTGALALINRVSAQGGGTNQVMMHPGGRFAVSVNYMTGNLVAYRTGRDGALSEAFYVDQHKGPPESSPKAHGLAFSHDGKWLYVAQLGLDRVYAYRVDPVRSMIVPGDPPYVALPAGSGPRRLQMSPDDKFLYVNHETDNKVSVLAVKGARVHAIQTLPTLPPDYTGLNKTAEIAMSPDGRFLYISNRGHDSIALFAIDRTSGLLTARGTVPAGGKTPRNLRFDPTGSYLLSSNEGSASITVFKVDKASGALTSLGIKAGPDTPAGLFFVPVE